MTFENVVQRRLREAGMIRCIKTSLQNSTQKKSKKKDFDFAGASKVMLSDASRFLLQRSERRFCVRKMLGEVFKAAVGP